MTDLISRQAALEIVFDFAETPHNMYQHIRELPTIDPVKHGKWVAKDDGTIVCSLCGDFWGRADLALKYLRYCPNCGASMNGGEDDGPV